MAGQAQYEVDGEWRLGTDKLTHKIRSRIITTDTPYHDLAVGDHISYPFNCIFTHLHMTNVKITQQAYIYLQSILYHTDNKHLRKLDCFNKMLVIVSINEDSEAVTAIYQHDADYYYLVQIYERD